MILKHFNQKSVTVLLSRVGGRVWIVDPHQQVLIPTLMFSLMPDQCAVQVCSYAECRARVMIVVAVQKFILVAFPVGVDPPKIDPHPHV
jgi:hypothetical protein